MDTLWLLAISTVISVGFAFAVAWLVRVAPRAALSAYQLDDVSVGYLFGGRVRAQEFALYSLLRDGWVKGDENSVFTARFRDAAPDMNAVEREILKCIADGGGITIQKQARLDLASMKDVERRLVRKRLIVDPRRLPLYNLVSRLPLGVCILFAVKQGGEHYIRHETFIAQLIIGTVAWLAVHTLRRQFSHRTAAGEVLQRHLLKEISERTRSRTETDADGRVYDRLWSLRERAFDLLSARRFFRRASNRTTPFLARKPLI